MLSFAATEAARTTDRVMVFGSLRRLARVAKASGASIVRHGRTGEPLVVVNVLRSAGVLSAKLIAGDASLAMRDSSFRRVSLDAFLAMIEVAS